MKIVEHLRLDAARLTAIGLVAGLAAVSAIDAQASSPAVPAATVAAAAPSPLAKTLFAPAAPVATTPLLSDAARLALVPQVKPASFTAGVAAPALKAAAPSLKASAALDFGFPLPGYQVNSRFGLRQLSYEPHARLHEGVDIAAPIGTQIHAAAAGRVTRTGLSSSYGNFVEVTHADGLTSFYAHMSRTAGLKPGAEVAEGEVLGFVGSTGHSTGPHLHFEIRHDGRPLDPQAFMGHDFASAGDLPLVQARAPGVLTGFRRRLKVLASMHWHVRGHANFRLAAYHHARARYARG